MIESLSEVVDGSSECRRLLQDGQLNQKAEDLYVAIIMGTEAVIYWLSSNTFSKLPGRSLSFT